MALTPTAKYRTLQRPSPRKVRPASGNETMTDLSLLISRRTPGSTGRDLQHPRQPREALDMFGIGLPEMLLIMALALIVIGPDKLPDLARSLAKGLLDLKKTAESLKNSMAEEGNVLAEIKPQLEEAAKSLKEELLDPQALPAEKPSADPAAMAAAAYEELLKQTATNPAAPPPADEDRQSAPSEEPSQPSPVPSENGGDPGTAAPPPRQ
jgi:sec-independent protein translocase protein TatB